MFRLAATLRATPGPQFIRVVYDNYLFLLPADFRSRPLQLRLQARIAARADDDMVDQFYLEDRAGLDQLPRGVDVVLRGGRIAAGVVVADDDARAVAGDGGAEDLGHAQDRAVDGSLVAQHVAHHLVLAIQQQDAQLLVVQAGHLHHHQVRRVGGRVDAVLLSRLQHAQAPPDLQGSLELRRLGLPHAVLGAQLAEVGPHQAREAAVPAQQLARQLEGVLAAGAGAQGDGEQFGRRERLRSRVFEALSRLFVGRQVAHGGVVVQPGVRRESAVALPGDHNISFLLANRMSRRTNQSHSFIPNHRWQKGSAERLYTAVHQDQYSAGCLLVLP